MDSLIHVESDHPLITRHDALADFRKQVQLGLGQLPKKIPSRFFYDEHGSELFNQITRHPDYYLTGCELEILRACNGDISRLMRHAPFNLIELGPGEGIKTVILLDQLLRDGASFTYMPVDISTLYLQTLRRQISQRLPGLSVTAIHADFFQGLEWIASHSRHRNLALFLGSSIGNFDRAETLEFLRHLWSSLNNGDYVLLGFDLRKDIDVLMRAYDDSDGITREFNLNLLTRINRELGGNFVLEKFQHYATYNVYTGAMESYLVSQERQTVFIDAVAESFTFEAFEPIHLEYSHKYRPGQISEMAENTGFRLLQNFVDSHEYFVDSLWQVRK